MADGRLPRLFHVRGSDRAPRSPPCPGYHDGAGVARPTRQTHEIQEAHGLEHPVVFLRGKRLQRGLRDDDSGRRDAWAECLPVRWRERPPHVFLYATWGGIARHYLE